MNSLMNNPTQKFAGILFDLDGTLLDSARDLHACLTRLCVLYQQPAVTLLQVQCHLNQGATALIRLAFGEVLSETVEHELRTKLLDDYQSMMDNQPVHFFDGTLQLLNALTAQKISWGIVTNKYERFTIPILKNLNLYDQAQVLICGDHVRNAKPDAEPLLKACVALQCDPTACCYVGDNLHDITAAGAAGMPGFLACWGYWPRLHYSIEGWPYSAVFYQPEDFLHYVTE